MKSRPLTRVLAVLAFTICNVAAFADESSLSSKWRIEVSEGANSDGTISFRITPKDGLPVEVAVKIDDGRGENDVAKDIRDALTKALDSKAFNVEVDDGEDVLVKKKGDGPDFEVKLVGESVDGVRVEVEHE
jgi:hypothetical protein